MYRKIKTGIASFGMSGSVFHAPLINSNTGFELSAIVERHADKSREKYGFSKLFRSFDDLRNDKEIELVVVNTPDYLHFEHAKFALEAGKHVVVEKPFTQKYDDARTLMDLAQKKNLILSVFQNRRWDGDFLTVQKIIKDKMLGRLVSFESHFDRYRNFIQEGTWKEESESGTGIVYNLGTHLIDQAIVLFGAPVGVSAEIKTLRTGGKVDDYFTIQLEYNENMSVSLRGSMLVKEQGPRYILHGTEGSFLKWGTDPQEQDLKDGKIPGQPGWGKEKEEEWGLLHTAEKGKDFRGDIETIPGNYQTFYNGIYLAIRENNALPVDPTDSALCIKIVEAAFESSLLGKVVTLNNYA